MEADKEAIGLRLEVRGKKMSGYVFPFEKLDVWQLAVDLAEFVLDLLEERKNIKQFASQINQLEHTVDLLNIKLRKHCCN